MAFDSKKRINLGQTGEKMACNHLKKKGYLIKETNYKVSVGEIDIIAEHNGDLVFIEVKTRSGDDFGLPAEAVTIQKQKQIIRVAQHYSAQKNCFDSPARFDVVSVLMGGDGKPVVEVIENAFEQN